MLIEAMAMNKVSNGLNRRKKRIQIYLWRLGQGRRRGKDRESG